MKNELILFYSWLSDLPDSDNKNMIRSVLYDEAKAIGKELNIKIKIDTDSRGEDGSKNIDDIILKKITNADLFVADVTPISQSKNKLIPNPNVIYELGFAASTLGWNRCILVWNKHYGDVQLAPFDIRNHSITTYNSPEKPNLHSIIMDKVKHLDQLICDCRCPSERSFDLGQYKAITAICSEKDMVDSIYSFFRNRRFNGLEFDWWDNTYHNYTYYPGNRFLDEELHVSFTQFLKNLNSMIVIACTYNKCIRNSNRPEQEVGTDDYKRECIYIIRDPYEYQDSQSAIETQKTIDESFSSLRRPLLDSYTKFRDLIKKKLLI